MQERERISRAGPGAGGGGKYSSARKPPVGHHLAYNGARFACHYDRPPAMEIDDDEPVVPQWSGMADGPGLPRPAAPDPEGGGRQRAPPLLCSSSKSPTALHSLLQCPCFLCTHIREVFLEPFSRPLLSKSSSSAIATLSSFLFFFFLCFSFISPLTSSRAISISHKNQTKPRPSTSAPTRRRCQSPTIWQRRAAIK